MYGRMSPTFFELFCKNVGFRLEDYVFFPRVGGGWTERGAGIGIQVLGRIF